MTGWKSRCRLDQGRWDEAAASAASVVEHPGVAPPTRVTPLIVLGLLRARRGDPDPWGPLDEARGIVYVPTGSAAADFYGADRPGDNLFANSLLALNAETGQRIWHFQVVRHDLWDRDLPSPPSLVRLRQNGRTIDAVVQTTKHGFVFVFDRTNGTPLFPIEYRKYPPSEVPGEITADTQPIPTRPKPFARQQLTEDILTTRTPEAHSWAVEAFRKLRNGVTAARRHGPPADSLGPSGDWVDVVRALSALPVPHRQVVVLHYLVGLEVTAVAAELQVPVGTVKSRLARARELLAPLLAEESHA